MNRAVVLTLMLLLSGCASVSSPNAICDGTVGLRDAHTDALIADGGTRSVQTGADLIAALDAGCAQ
jgi:uncharacterized protein YceK